jgi:hypothetical protein
MELSGRRGVRTRDRYALEEVLNHTDEGGAYWLVTLCKFVGTHEAHGEAFEDSARIDEQGRSIMTLRCRMCWRVD